MQDASSYTFGVQNRDNKKKWQWAYHDAIEALERIRAVELAAMTDEDARRCIESLSTVEQPWRDQPNWSGLVERQAAFHRKKI
jgi:hypothetical protein